MLVVCCGFNQWNHPLIQSLHGWFSRLLVNDGFNDVSICLFFTLCCSLWFVSQCIAGLISDGSIDSAQAGSCCAVPHQHKVWTASRKSCLLDVFCSFDGRQLAVDVMRVLGGETWDFVSLPLAQMVVVVLQFLLRCNFVASVARIDWCRINESASTLVLLGCCNQFFVGSVKVRWS